MEIEVSPWSYETETQQGKSTAHLSLSLSQSNHYRTLVIATAKDLEVVVIAYAPLGRGFLTGKITSRADLAKDDMRLRLERFSEEVWRIKHLGFTPRPLTRRFRI